MTLEQAKEKLERMRSRKDPLLSSFHGGRVGFRKNTKKYRQEIDRTINEAIEFSRLYEFIKNEEAKIFNKEHPKPSPYYASVNEFELGKSYNDCFLGAVTITKINKATVTIKTESGYTETRKPHFIYK